MVAAGCTAQNKIQENMLELLQQEWMEWTWGWALLPAPRAATTRRSEGVLTLIEL